MQRLVRDSPRVRGEGWAFIGGYAVRDPKASVQRVLGPTSECMQHKLAKTARRPIFTALRDRLLWIRLRGKNRHNFGTARARERRGQLPEERVLTS